MGAIAGFIVFFLISFSVLSGTRGIPKYLDLQSVYTYLIVIISSLSGIVGLIIGLVLGLIYGKIKNK